VDGVQRSQRSRKAGSGAAEDPAIHGDHLEPGSVEVELFLPSRKFRLGSSAGDAPPVESPERFELGQLTGDREVPVCPTGDGPRLPQEAPKDYQPFVVDIHLGLANGAVNVRRFQSLGLEAWPLVEVLEGSARWPGSKQGAQRMDRRHLGDGCFAVLDDDPVAAANRPQMLAQVGLELGNLHFGHHGPTMT